MSSRDLRALGRTSTTNDGAGIVAVTKTLASHPCAVNINPSTQEGLKLFLKATEELSKEDKLSLSIENAYAMKNLLETCSHEFS